MKKAHTHRKFPLLLITAAICSLLFQCATGCGPGLRPQDTAAKLQRELERLPGVQSVERLAADSCYAAQYRIFIEQPLDHNNPQKGTFPQQLLLSHIHPDSPMVLITEGYALGKNQIAELAPLLGANQLRVEHRYFGASLPDSMDWRYLNIMQAAADYHFLVSRFTELYTGPWLNSGWSKGGQTALIHRRYYPYDVRATVAYVTPLNFSTAEPRIDRFFDTVGNFDCRRRLVRFQRAILRHKEEIVPRFRWYARGKGLAYSIGYEKALEYIVLEYPFSFWQYHHIDCADIPVTVDDLDALLKHLEQVVSFSSYSDQALNSPAMYQFYTELGYYEYVTRNVIDLLSGTEYPNRIFAPQDVELKFIPELMEDLDLWVRNQGDNILFIYGDHDPWSAPGVVLTGQTNALKMTLKGGNHYSQIGDFPADAQERMRNTLRGWLGILAAPAK